MEKKSVLCIRSDSLYLERLSMYLEGFKKDHVVEILKTFDVLPALIQSHPVVLLVTIRNQTEYQELLTTLSSLTSGIASRSLITVVVQSGLTERHESALIKAGCKEVVPYKADLKGLNVKIARHLKIAEQNFKAAQATDSSQSKHASSGAGKPKSPEGGAADLVSFVEPVMLERDYWVLNHRRPAQRNMGRWIVTAIGPSPGVGSWVAEGGPSKYYVFRVHPTSKGDFHSDEGCWVFHGSKPEFSFEMGRWSFVGNDPKLEWVAANGSVIAIKLRYSPETKKLVVAMNSEQTLKWLPKIEATFDRDYRFRDDAIAGPGIESGGNFDAKELELRANNLVKDIPEEVVTFLKDATPHFKPKAEMFAKLNEKKTIDKFFEVAGEYQDRGILWLGGRLFLSDLRVHSVDLQQRHVEVVMVPPVLDPVGLIDEALASNEDKRVFVNIKLLETSLFYYVEREQIQCEDGVLKLPIPSDAYEVQRRGGARLSNSPKIPGLEITKIPPTAKGDWKLIDLSPGGIGLEMASDSFSFAEDRPFKIEIKLQVHTLNLICRPRWTKLDEMKGKVRVGAQFENLSPTVREKLELYIMEKHLDRIRQTLKK